MKKGEESWTTAALGVLGFVAILASLWLLTP